jgi:hypothetical protein
MNMSLQKEFVRLWERYFGGAELPLTFFFSPDTAGAHLVDAPDKHICIIAQMAAARRGRPLAFNLDSVGCGGGKRWTGMTEQAMEGIEHFLSCGIPGRLEGERYKKTPELAKAVMDSIPPFRAPHPDIVFKRWDCLEATDEPEVAVFFGTPDVISGVFGLANYDEPGLEPVCSPWGAGCATLVGYPCIEQQRDHPRCVLGMFDISARPWVQKDTLTLAVPMKKLATLIENMEGSFLGTASWERVSRRF